MSLDPGDSHRSGSPASSGRSTPVNPLSRSKLEDDAFRKDKPYRRYASTVERALSMFDTTLQDWADYISFLGRLLKALQTHPNEIAVVPHRALVAKRLAQCLNPTLPAGVHQKALETYSYIFSLIGIDALSRDLPLYFPGLSSVLSFASLSVRPLYLSLMETYILPLHAYALRPALKGIILSILPGLEEETSDDFEHTLGLLKDFRKAVRRTGQSVENNTESAGDSYFWQCFFLASTTAPSRRTGALAYLVRELPKFINHSNLENEDINNGHNGDAASGLGISSTALDVVSPEPGLLVRCFATGLDDQQILIQRGFLDLLVSHLPLHSPVLQQKLPAEGLGRLVSAAVGVVSRRDMSLNRRLWAWLLGPESSSGNEENAEIYRSSGSGTDATVNASAVSDRARYFARYGLKSLVGSLLDSISKDISVPALRAKPFRICLSLMDRWEVGGLVVPEVFLPMMNNALVYKQTAKSPEDFQDVLRSANVFFDGVEGGLIWAEIVNLVGVALMADSLSANTRLEKLRLVDFIITHFNVREEEMLVVHIPLTALFLLTLINECMSNDLENENTKFGQTLDVALGLSERLMSMIPERAFLTNRSPLELIDSKALGSESTSTIHNVTKEIRRFYEADQGNLDSSLPPFSGSQIGEMLLRLIADLVSSSLRSHPKQVMLEPKARLLVLLLERITDCAILRDTTLFSTFAETLSNTISGAKLAFTTFSAILSALIALNSALSTDQNTVSDELAELCPHLVQHAWSFVSPNDLKYHVEAVHCLWQLHFATFSTRLVEASICRLMVTENTYEEHGLCSVDAGQRLSVVWAHSVNSHWGSAGVKSGRVQRLNSTENVKHVMGNIGDYDGMLTRPLLLLLDTLATEGTEVYFFTRGWVHSLSTFDKVLRIFVAKLSAFDFLKLGPHSDLSYDYGNDYDLEQCCYYLYTLSNLLKCSSNNAWTALTRETFSIEEDEGHITLQVFFTKICMRAISGEVKQPNKEVYPRIAKLQRAALSLLRQILLGPYHMNLADLELEYPLIDRLMASLVDFDSSIQVSLLDVLFASLKMRLLRTQTVSSPKHKRTTSKDTLRSPSRLSVVTENSEKENTVALPNPPPPQLVRCLQAGFSTPSSRPILDNWISFLAECLPLFTDTIFEVLLPLVECLNQQVRKIFASLKSTFAEASGPRSVVAGETTILALLDGVEQVLATAHDRLVTEEIKNTSTRNPEQPQGFFGNMVSGVWASDAPQARNPAANNRLTVLLSFEDVVNICFDIWAWAGYGSETNNQDPASLASFSYTSLRVRNRARRLLEHLFAAEALECLETLAEIWKISSNARDQPRAPSVFNLLLVLDGSRPKNTVPAIFDGIYSRANANALEPRRRSALTTDLTANDLVSFLVAYVRTVEDDAMDEIWTDCMTFLRDVLANSTPHRQTLPGLLEFTALLGEKVDNTNFGEQRKMRRDLGDVFTRMLTTTFTARPTDAAQDTALNSAHEKSLGDDSNSDDMIAILCAIVPNLGKILVESDRIAGTVTAVSTNIIGPAFHSKAFPETVSPALLMLLYHLARVSNTSKSWRRDVSDAFNNVRFFQSPRPMVEHHWLPLIRQLLLNDRDRLPELLSRISAPTSAGIVFGVGASSARLEADRKTQLNLRRLATFILAADDDTFVINIPGVVEKLVELLSATAASSPSSITRVEVYMVFRALVLKISPIHLAPLWPVVESELRAAISSVLPEETSEVYNDFTVVHACKLLDILVIIAPDDFQLHEWLFITDTIDAVYRPSDWRPIALVDDVSEGLNTTVVSAHTSLQAEASAMIAEHGRKRPLLNAPAIRACPREKLLTNVIKPFLSELSIYAFESTYSMSTPDWEACKEDLLADLFDESTIVA